MKKIKLKKGKITVVITIAIACFALITVMFMQFKVVNETDITSIETMKYEEKTTKLSEYEEKKQSNVESSELVQNELEQVNMYLGKTDVTGEGIKITLKDFVDEDGNLQSITAEDLLVIVDYLKSAGAEAISINEERITNMSDIVYISDSIIYINQQRVLSPYQISAIGNQTYLESILLGNGGYVDELKKLGFEVNIEKGNKITIPKYKKELPHKYIQ